MGRAHDLLVALANGREQRAFKGLFGRTKGYTGQDQPPERATSRQGSRRASRIQSHRASHPTEEAASFQEEAGTCTVAVVMVAAGDEALPDGALQRENDRHAPSAMNIAGGESII